MFLTRLLTPTISASAHCDLPCGVYDPEQARIEAESCYKIIEKYNASSDEQFKAAYLRATESMAPRLLVPLTSMKPADPGYRDHVEFFQRHLDCLRASGLSDGEVVGAVAAQACILLQKRGAAP